MDIEQAEKRIKILLADKCNCSECLKNKEAMQTVLNMLEEKDREIAKKDKIIYLMADWLYKDDTSFGYGKLKNVNTPNEIKQYFEQKATNDG